MPFPEGSFDLVTCISVIEEFPDFRAAISEMARCVARGGVLVINVTNGVLLQHLYQLAEMAGRKIPESWWHYAFASKPIVKANSYKGYHIAGLEGWRYIHLTPYVIQGQSPIMKLLPISLLDIVSHRLAPTFVHAWQRPAESGEGRQ
jgi:SAM-dependent methyltransferase